MKFSILTIAAFAAAVSAVAVPINMALDEPEAPVFRRDPDDLSAVDPPAEDIVSGPGASDAAMSDSSGNTVTFNSANVYLPPNAGR